MTLLSSLATNWGILVSLVSQSFPPASKFNVDDIPDLTGKVVIVTGGNTGVGRETVWALLVHNATVYVAARNAEKSQQTIEALREVTGKTAIFLKLDLADLRSIKATVEEFFSMESRLDILFNNAGVMSPPIEEVTKDGYDLTFGTNVLGHFYLTKLLMPALLAAAKEASDGKARVVNTSSIAHEFVYLNFALFKDSAARRKVSSDVMYAQSKLGNVLFATELARREGANGIVSTSVHPGNIKTDLQRYLTGLRHYIISLSLYDTPYGALTQLYAGTAPDSAQFNGKYLVPWARIGTASRHSQDEALARELWKWMEEQVEGM